MVPTCPKAELEIPSYLYPVYLLSFSHWILGQSSIKPIFWKRFIDDVISAWYTSKNEIEEFLLKANSFHPTIKFTAEISETETTFLDTKVCKGVRFMLDHEMK